MMHGFGKDDAMIHVNTIETMTFILEGILFARIYYRHPSRIRIGAGFLWCEAMAGSVSHT